MQPSHLKSVEWNYDLWEKTTFYNYTSHLIHFNNAVTEQAKKNQTNKKKTDDSQCMATVTRLIAYQMGVRIVFAK